MSRRLLILTSACALALLGTALWASDGAGRPAHAQDVPPTLPLPTLLPTVTLPGGPPPEPATPTATPTIAVMFPATATPPGFAPSATPSPSAAARVAPTRSGPLPTNRPLARVRVPDAIVRAGPSLEAEAVGGVFGGDFLDVTGRNLDGSWLQVRRPGRDLPLGWVRADLLETAFPPETLPLTDFTTGAVGPSPLAEDPGNAVFLLQGPALRDLPSAEFGARIIDVPPLIVVPVLERYGEGRAGWYRINYLGYDGWIVGFAVRDNPSLASLPLRTALFPGLPELVVERIDPALQRAQVQRGVAFAQQHEQIARDLANYWEYVARGTIMPCTPPPETVTTFIATNRDIQELPELARYVPRMNEALGLLRASADQLANCGVLLAFQVNAARANATNASVIFRASWQSLQRVEALIR